MNRVRDGTVSQTPSSAAPRSSWGSTLTCGRWISGDRAWGSALRPGLTQLVHGQPSTRCPRTSLKEREQPSGLPRAGSMPALAPDTLRPWADPDSRSPFGPCPLLHVLVGTHSRVAGLDGLINREAFSATQKHLGVSIRLLDLAPRQPQLPGSRPRERAAR